MLWHHQNPPQLLHPFFIPGRNIKEVDVTQGSSERAKVRLPKDDIVNCGGQVFDRVSEPWADLTSALALSKHPRVL